jgi:hypothetical protein
MLKSALLATLTKYLAGGTETDSSILIHTGELAKRER